jgi:Asp-tRNA(Asn)/Glu-tRNA(Gln) amidotransferase C subunit
MSDDDRTLTPAETAVLAKAARLPLDESRLAPVSAALSMVLGQFDALDAVDLGETPPTNAFDARWRTRP